MALFVLAQAAGAILGTALAHLMFELPPFQPGTTARGGPGQLLAEAVATFGLVLTVIGTAERAPQATPYAVGLYVTAAYWFTSSTAFANPAVTLTRALTDTFTGIRPVDAPGFVVAQLAGMFLASRRHGSSGLRPDQCPGGLQRQCAWP